jgi:ATP-dependent Clp protease protease subunit
MRETLNDVLAQHTGQPVERIAQDTERDYFMDSEAARKYGIIDQMVERKS